jgi:hypothetical protein
MDKMDIDHKGNVEGDEFAHDRTHHARLASEATGGRRRSAALTMAAATVQWCEPPSTRTEVDGLAAKAWGVDDLVERRHVAGGQVHDRDVVADGGAIWWGAREGGGACGRYARQRVGKAWPPPFPPCCQCLCRLNANMWHAAQPSPWNVVAGA